jgi:hypothetical protein
VDHDDVALLRPYFALPRHFTSQSSKTTGRAAWLFPHLVDQFIRGPHRNAGLTRFPTETVDSDMFVLRCRFPEFPVFASLRSSAAFQPQPRW